MALSTGTRLGPYEILAPLGAGGMGEVYRARDSRLERTVAIKVLNSSLVASPELKARFEREARVVSQLQHPNICVLHDVGSENGIGYLVMEFLDGESLSQRLRRGPLAVPELLKIAIEIADALSRAHRAGIVHRDLKPGNVMLTKTGAKLLDFGLAKPLSMSAAAGAGAASHSVLNPALTQSAPAVSPASPLSSAGAVIGTVQYMSPEQIQGLEADARSDIFAFGAMLFEMATGETAFKGKTQASLVGQILAVDPPAVTTLQPSLPAGLAGVVQVCLQKDPEERFQSAHDLKLQLQMLADTPQRTPPFAGTRSRLRAWVAAAGVLAVAFTASVWFAFGRKAPPPDVSRFEIDFGSLQIVLTSTMGSRFAISPDGSTVVAAFHGADGKSQLYARRVDSFDVVALPGTEGATQPFFSPDSKWVGFSAAGKLKKVSLAGGLPITLCGLSTDSVAATWGDNGSIVFNRPGNDLIYRVAAEGGNPTEIPIGNDAVQDHRWPVFLPGSRAFLLGVLHEGRWDIDLVRLDSGKTETLIREGSWPRYLPDGHILYAQYSSGGDINGFTGGLLVVPFDLKQLKVTGGSTPVLQEVRVGTAGAGFYDVSANGTLVYTHGKPESSEVMDLMWLDTAGKVLPIDAPEHHVHDLHLSPDGSRLVFTMLDGGPDIYLYDLQRKTMQRLTFDNASEYPIFTPDGKNIVYTRSEPRQLWMKPADGSGEARRLVESQYSQVPYAVSPDGASLAYTETLPRTRLDIYVASLHGDPAPRAFANTAASENDPAFSPDGKFLAYTSNESGHAQVYVRHFPEGGGKWQVSTGVGDAHEPHWSRDGKKLYFVVGGTRLMAASVNSNGGFTAGTPTKVFEDWEFGHSGYDIAPDGHIIWARINAAEQPKANALRVIENFNSEVARRAASSQNR